MRPLTVALVSAALTYAGCGKTIVDLTPEPPDESGIMDDEGPAPGEITCGEELLAGDLLCKVCYQGGEMISRDCPLPLMEPALSPPSGLICFTRPSTDLRCLHCGKQDAEPIELACLKCLEPLDPGNPCRVCYWSDQDPNVQLCRSCVLDDGTTRDNCDELRAELPRAPKP